MLSATRGDRTSALAQLGRSDRLMRALLTGSHTLTGQVIASSMARRQWQTLASVAVAQPQWLVDLLPMVAALDARALDVRRWVAVEAAYQHEAIADVRRGCQQHGDGAPWGLSWLNRMMCRYDIGMQPNITGAAIDQHWLGVIEGIGSDPAAWLRRQEQAASDDGLHWRNTVGRLLLSVAAPASTSYVARMVDVELHRQALLAAWAARELPAEDRARWLAARALPTLAQGRLSLSADGRWLLAQPWSPDAAKQARLRIRIELPAV